MPRGIPADLVGQRFGSWTVTARSGSNDSRQALWLCHCACGNPGLVTTSNLTTGQSTRCRPCGNSKKFSARWTAPTPATQPDMSSSDQKVV